MQGSGMAKTRKGNALQVALLCAAFTLGLLANASAASFSNPTAITIPAGAPTTTQGPADPYPSTITVSGNPGTLLKARVTLTGITHTAPRDINVLLVGPTGQKTILWNEACGGGSLTGQSITFDDAAPATLPLSGGGPCLTGTYKPTSGSAVIPVYPSPAPAGPYPVALSALNGGAVNGAWSLFVFDDAGIDVGTIAGGWSLDLQATDITPPETVIGAKKIKGTTAKFKFSSNEPGSTFQCKLDKHSFKPCSSPKKYKNLSSGKHKFKVRAVDAAGNVDASPSKKKFTI
jgi:subtilisin-like proprotein convertase family protein